MSSNTGNILELRSETLFGWKLNNFQQYLKEGGPEYTSSVFSFLDACWRLGVKTVSPNNVEFFIRREDWGPPKTVKVKLGYFKVKEGKESYHFDQRCTFSEINASIGCQLRPLTVVPYADPLVILCCLNLGQGNNSVVSLFERLWNLSLSLRKIMSSGKESNIVLKVKDREIPAHRIILESRSTVFERMFGSEMQESKTGIICVNDMEEDVLKIVLSHMYSGETEGLRQENVVEVYKAAHKYDLEDLRKLCSVFLKDNLTIDCLCDVFVLADLYKETSLMEGAKKFFVKNSSAIRKTDKWVSFKSENSALCLELLAYMMEDK